MPIRANRDQWKCYYPNCLNRAAWSPIVCLPTVRTVGETENMVATTRPTVLIFHNICDEHKKTYDLTYWINPQDWERIRKEAQHRGFTIPEINVIEVQFKPLGAPILHSGYLEMDRG